MTFQENLIYIRKQSLYSTFRAIQGLSVVFLHTSSGFDYQNFICVTIFDIGCGAKIAVAQPELGLLH